MHLFTLFDMVDSRLSGNQTTSPDVHMIQAKYDLDTSINRIANFVLHLKDIQPKPIKTKC